ncbi:MAG: hypothetical protein A2020_15615 [Lentisphaerae bacterium GWF2_45_14]|nr:MAG: hypothetical protein A2020_15615 [Lentisphaerae bacterium GWF2_45_14]
MFIKSSITLVFLGLISCLCAGNDNFIKDNGFERSMPGKLGNWHGLLWAINGAYPGDAEVSYEKEKARNGEKFLRLKFEKSPGVKNDCMIVFDVFRYPVFRNKKYTFNVWARGEGRISVGFQGYGKNGQWFLLAGRHAPFRTLDKDKWQEFSYAYIPDESEYFLMCNISIEGQVDVDDPMLEITTCPKSEIKEKEMKKAAERLSATPRSPAGKMPMISSDSEDELLYGDFEKWSVSDKIPSGWNVQNRMLPDGWELEERADANGSISGIVNNSLNMNERFGKYSLLLDGRIVSKRIFENVNNKKVRISLMAKGKGGNLTLRLREYMGPPSNKVVNHIMEIMNVKTSGDWQKYTAEATLPRLGGPLVTAFVLEIAGSNVVIDDLKAELRNVNKEYRPIVYTIPVAHNNIRIDGDFSRSEWIDASGTNAGFVSPGANLAKRQSDFYLSSDGKNLLICLKTQCDTIKSKISQRDGNVWMDDSFEIHINPYPGNKKPHLAYQFIFNAAATVFDQRTIDGIRMPVNKNWDCRGLMAVSKFENNIWILEIAIPLDEVGISAGKEFGLNICKNLSNPAEALNLTGFGYFDYDKMVLCKIENGAPAVFWEEAGIMDGGNLSMSMTLFSSNPQKQNFDLSFSADTEKIQKTEKRKISLSPAGIESVSFSTASKAGTFGDFAVSLNSADKNIIVSHKVNFDMLATPKSRDEGSRIAYYPSQHKIGVIINSSAGRGISRIDFSIFKEGRLLQKNTESDIVTSENKIYAFAKFSSSDEGKYFINADIFDKENNCIEHLSDYIEIKNFPWMNNNIGKGKEILKPFIPLSIKVNAISCWGRRYILAGSGLPEQIISQNENVLTAPIAFTCMKDGSVHYGRNGELKFSRISEESISFTGETLFPAFKIIANGKIEYDGTVFYDFEIVPESDFVLPQISFRIPFRNLKYFHNSGMGVANDLWISCYPEEGQYIDNSVPVWTPGFIYIPKGARVFSSLYFPKEDGIIWTSENIKNTGYANDFLPYLTFGNNIYGISWFANNDRGWISSSENPSYKIAREKDSSTVIINLIAKAPEAKQPIKISFGLAATPVRQKKTGMNYFDYSVQGFGESSFTDKYGGGLSIKDSFLFDKYISYVNHLGKRPVFFYICKSYLPLGDDVFKYFYNDWHSNPEVSYNSFSNIPTKKYGLDPDDYFAPGACLYPERIDYMVFKIDKLVKENPKLGGIYWDENYSVPCTEFAHENCGYKKDDGKIQPGLHLFEMRELDKRVQSIFQKYGRHFPDILVHSTAMIPALYSFADISLCAERGTRGLDFIAYWDLPRVENAAAGAWGVNIMWLPQWGSAHGGTVSDNTVENNRSMLAMLKLFDLNTWQILCIPQLLQKFRDIELKFGIATEDSRFYGYWQKENNAAVSGIPTDVKASFFVRPGKAVLLYISNLNKKEQDLEVNLDFSAFAIEPSRIIDAETGEEVHSLQNKFKLKVKGHDFRCLEILNHP